MGYFKERSHRKQKANRNLIIYLVIAIYAYLSYLSSSN